jgi:ribonucleoside-diphosphate reductase alpha chain
MRLTDNARVVLENRYLIRDENGKPVETVDEMVERVAKAVAQPELLYGGEEERAAAQARFEEMLQNLDFLPNSPTLMNAGRKLGQLSACFVLPVEDSMEAIFEAIKRAALIHKSGGGTGFSFSRLRPKGSTVNSTGGVASGPISFMRVFNTATEAVKQGGTRRGANMGILRIDHPDILEFIDCKKDNTDITNFNISVGITENFMKAVINDEEYDLIDPSTQKTVKKLSAKAVFEKIVDAAWRNGEPGIIFLDRLNRDNVVPCCGEIESTNPCGEQPLLPFEACNLGSINLHKMLKDDGKAIDWDKLKTTVKDAVHFLDNVIDANRYPLPEIDKMTKQTRKVGLGIMGWADMLFELGIPYNSDEAVNLADKLMGFINENAIAESIELAKKRGAFPLFEKSTFKDGAKRRNATVTTIAPTGTLSIIAGCSSGVEPVFANVYIRNVMDGTELIEVNSVLKRRLEERGIYSDELMRKIAKEGSLANIKEIPEDIRRVFVCAHDVSPEYHIKMQAAFQRHTENAVSKTVNFKNSATRDDVRDVYMLAYKLGCKGVTIYRDGSRDSQVLNIGKVNNKKSSVNLPRPRPEVTTGFTEKVRIGCGNLYITVNYDDKGICEVFTNTGRAGGCPSQSEATARLVSIALRSGIDTDVLIEQLKGIRCPSTIRQQGMKVTSCPDAIARVIEKVKRFQDSGSVKPDKTLFDKKNDVAEHIYTNAKYCPECGQKLEHEGGCVTCRNCGYSKCG